MDLMSNNWFHIYASLCQFLMLKIEIEDRGCYYLVVIQSMEVKGDKKKISLTQSTVPGMQIYMCVHLLSSKSS